MSVLETGSLQNHTRTRLHRPKFKDVPKEGEEDEEEEEESSSDEDDEREPNDSKLMCAPILKPNDVTMGVHGHTVSLTSEAAAPAPPSRQASLLAQARSPSDDTDGCHHLAW